MTGRVELYGARTGNCMRASIALGEAGVQYEAKQVSLRRREQKSPSYLDLNPAGKVPVLVETNESGRLVLSQSIAIVLHASQRPGSALAGIGPDRAGSIILERFCFVVTDIVGNEFGAIILNSQGDQRGSSLLLQRMISELESAERYAAEARFLGGPVFSVVDIAAFPTVSAVADYIPWDQFPNLHRWYQEVGGRSAVQSGMRAFV